MRWFESQVWPNGRRCGHCGGTITSEVPNAKPMPQHDLSQLLQRADWHGVGAFEGSASEVGYRHLPRTHQPEEHQ